MAEAAKKDLGNEDLPSVEDLQAQIADLTKQNDAIKSKSDELLAETKKAKNLKRESEEAAKKIAEDKAKADGDHEQLYNSALVELEKLKDINKQNRIDHDKSAINTHALGIAAKLAEGSNVNLIKVFVAQRLKATDDGIKVTDSNGNLTISSMDDLATEFKNNSDYSSLLKGNQSSGGGAVSGSNSGSAAKVITRAEFDALDVVARSKFMKDGGSINQ